MISSEMCTEEEEEFGYQKALKNLCCSNGWSYAVFWSFNPHNSLQIVDYARCVLRRSNGNCDMMSNWSSCVYYEAPVDFLRAYYGEKKSLGLSQDMFQDDCEFNRQFSSGIKILETMEFVNQTKRFLQEMGNDYALTSSENATSSSKFKQ